MAGLWCCCNKKKARTSDAAKNEDEYRIADQSSGESTTGDDRRGKEIGDGDDRRGKAISDDDDGDGGSISSVSTMSTVGVNALYVPLM
mmetsp:Transcript_5936/g.10828  ORF Transcript_5936/g.10828 Transcript_5936/m.10828 type:complete len:88 (-) Transcript_5936:71-334(-)|eukprot:CAMPEP_0201626592 /NCGR_PEP_ID=MMETSP0493-20130528/1908_1 /ASSEMBLY_ACC=CAM_ASM_000838 /TAXON_ID=420259 /ORGANISM="Thalassiosira gravida, Strain GMp14c1" /LENGTH=87 /DNA_ID=CAMNT_0048096699 /DNA_START=218 /DNA_END=481 /DNA_ORIENTATION=-